MTSCRWFKALVSMLSEVFALINTCSEVAEYLLAARSVYKMAYIVMVMEFLVMTALCGKTEIVFYALQSKIASCF